MSWLYTLVHTLNWSADGWLVGVVGSVTVVLGACVHLMVRR